MISAKQLRAVLGSGGQVVDSAGQQVGRIVDIVLSPLSFEPAWVTVACDRGPVVVVPLAAARRLDGCLQLPYAAVELFSAPDAPEAIGHLTPERAGELAGYFDSSDGYGAADRHAPELAEGPLR